MNRRKRPHGTIVDPKKFTVTLNESTYVILKDRALINGRSMASEVNIILDQVFEAEERERRAARR